MTEQKNWLNAVRGIGCLMVLLSHLGALSENYGMYFNGCGKIGVWLFLVLSGFWFMYPLCQKECTISIKRVLAFYGKKLFRMYTVYAVALAAAYFSGMLTEWEAIFRHLLLVDGASIFWYMPVIIKFYVIAPIFWAIRAAVKNDGILTVILALVAAGFVFLFPFAHYEENSTALYWYLPVIIMGMITAIACNQIERRGIAHKVADIFPFILLSIIALMTPAARYMIWGIDPSSFLQNKYIYIGAIWSVTIAAMFVGSGWKKLLNRCGILQWVGEISYPVYLIHYPIITVIFRFAWIYRVKCIVVFCVTIVVAALIHKTVEVPSQKLGRKLADGRVDFRG